jgi:hypothetical protein
MADINIGLVLILIMHCFKNLNQFFTTVNTSFSFGKVKLVPVTWGEPAGRIRFHSFFLMYLFLMLQLFTSIYKQSLSINYLVCLELRITHIPKVKSLISFVIWIFDLVVISHFQKVPPIYESVGSIPMIFKIYMCVCLD